MCCKTSVHPLDPELAATILTIGRFVPASLISDDGEIPRFWKRDIPEEHSTVNVSLTGGCFEISIAPSISNFDHHLGKRITAGVYFEISAKYAEKVGGEIIQRATVVGCKDTEQGTGLVIARYPGLPMSFERVCAGFQQVLLFDPGHEHLDLGNGQNGTDHEHPNPGQNLYGRGYGPLDLGQTA